MIGERLYPWASLPVGVSTCGRLYPWASLPVGVSTCGRLYPNVARPVGIKPMRIDNDLMKKLVCSFNFQKHFVAHGRLGPWAFRSAGVLASGRFDPVRIDNDYR